MDIYTELTEGNSIADWSSKQWLDYCLQKEAEVMEARETTLHDGRTVKMESLPAIRRATAYWRKQVNLQKQPRSRRFGGFRVKTADMSR